MTNGCSCSDAVHGSCFTALHHFSSALQSRYAVAADTRLEQFLTRFFQLRQVANKGHLISAGEIARQVYFIHRGIFRVYYIDPQGNEVNQQFYQPGEVVAPVLSLTRDEPSPFYLQALTDAEVLQAPYPDLQRAGRNDAMWLAAENAILKAVYLNTARREAQMLLGGAEQRYRWFLRENPQLAEQLPLYQIASYLNVTPVSLSRLRKKLSQSSTG